MGLPPLVKRLHRQEHDALRMRIAVELRFEVLDRTSFGAAVEHAFKNAGVEKSMTSDPAVELLYRARRGVMRSPVRANRCHAQSSVRDCTMWSLLLTMVASIPSPAAAQHTAMVPAPALQAG